MNGEVVTLQLGNYSNFVGSHFWGFEAQQLINNVKKNTDITSSNIQQQEEIEEKNEKIKEFNSDVFFHDSSSLVPRLITIDTIGSMNSNRLQYQQRRKENIPATWDGPIQRFDQSEAYNDNTGGMDSNRNEAKFWNEILDQNHIQLHDKTIFQLPGLHHDVSPFDTFFHGTQFYRNEENVMDEILDRIRFFIEYCDHFQGFQCICDIHSAFCGLGSELLSDLNDEYSHNDIVFYGTSFENEEESSRATRNHALNSILSLQRIYDVSSLYIPLDARVLRQELSRDLYNSSALLASGIHTSAVPFNIYTSHPTDMSEVVSLLCPRPSMKLASLSLSLPLPLPFVLPDPTLSFVPDSNLSLKVLQSVSSIYDNKKNESYYSPPHFGANFLHNLSMPSFRRKSEIPFSLSEHLNSQWVVTRGIPLCLFDLLTPSSSSLNTIGAYATSGMHWLDALRMHSAEQAPTGHSIVRSGFPYPKLGKFADFNLNFDTNLLPASNQPRSTPVPLLSTLHSSSFNYFQFLDAINTYDRLFSHKLATNSIDSDFLDGENTRERLLSISDDYMNCGK